MSSCKATHGNGEPCRCTSLSKRDRDEKCVCKHKRMQHHNPSNVTVKEKRPEAELYSVLSKYSTDCKAIPQRPKTAAMSEARKETNTGFRVKASAASKSGAAGRNNRREKPWDNSSKVPKRTVKDSSSSVRALKYSKIGSVLLIPCGLNSQGQPQSEKAPDGKKIESLWKFQLAVYKDPQGGGLEYGESWMHKRIDTWLRHLFPWAFQWLDLKFGRPAEGEYHWVLVKKQYSKIYLLERDTIAPDDLHNARGSTNRNFKDYCLRFVTRQIIAATTYRDWQCALEHPDEPSDDDATDVSNSAASGDSDEESSSRMKTPVNKRTMATRSSKTEPTVITISDNESSDHDAAVDSSSPIKPAVTVKSKGKQRAQTPVDSDPATPTADKQHDLNGVSVDSDVSPSDSEHMVWSTQYQWGIADDSIDDSAMDSSLASPHKPTSHSTSFQLARVTDSTPAATTAVPDAQDAGPSSTSAGPSSVTRMLSPPQSRHALSDTYITNSPTPSHAPLPLKQVVPSRWLTFARTHKPQYDPWKA
ncbi:hypothetical protein NLJ89_g11222 [Agrocybe chaxingu]|uniref:Uncharacterized protein n=1 Tax=Agrocybe chaxingu TaxID=84603 RepID=A0A9W8JP45_9AGAR|nr:hypothetical protein NLJ89_g11222 [Agrocybe chaxingu]